MRLLMRPWLLDRPWFHGLVAAAGRVLGEMAWPPASDVWLKDRKT